MALTLHRGPVETPRTELSKGKYVVATLGLLIDVVGRRSMLGMLLNQTRNEILSLIDSDNRSQAA